MEEFWSLYELTALKFILTELSPIVQNMNSNNKSISYP